VKQIFFAAVLFLAGCSGISQSESAGAKPKRCIFSTQVVSYRVTSDKQPKRGFFLYVDADGAVSGDIYKNGKLESSWEGDHDYSQAMHAAFRKAAIPDINWPRHIEKVRLGVIARGESYWDAFDGYSLRIQMDFEGSKCDFTMHHTDFYVSHYAGADELLKRLDDLLGIIATEYGRKKLRS